METTIVIELSIASITILAAVVLGYLGQKVMGAAMLGIGAVLASVLCIGGTLLGLALWENTGGWIGLLTGILLTGLLGRWASNKLVRGKSGWFTAGIWFGFCALCIFSYVAGGWLGLLTITLPSVGIFWIGMYRIAAYILPLNDKHRERPKAFQSLITFTMGTNYPYYVIEKGQRQERVPGNPYNQFFAGPGIVFAGCDQAVYITDGVKVKGLGKPGLTFTEMFDLPPKVVDLRPQLRAFQVEALTKDGIPIRVLTFIPFQIRRRDQEPQIGTSFPFEPRAVFQAVATEPVERGRTETVRQKHEWNVDLIPIITTRIVQDILCEYTVDELCAANDPTRDPRVEIVDKMKAKLSEALPIYGIELLGGGISNLLPQDPCVMERRLENWQTRWEHEILLEFTEGEAERVRQIERARARAEADVILTLGRIVEQSVAEGTATETALALRFIDCLGELTNKAEDQWPIPEALRETFNKIRGKLAPGRC